MNLSNHILLAHSGVNRRSPVQAREPAQKREIEVRLSEVGGAKTVWETVFEFCVVSGSTLTGSVHLADTFVAALRKIPREVRIMLPA